MYPCQIRRLRAGLSCASFSLLFGGDSYIFIAFAILFNAPKRAILPITFLAIVALLVSSYMLEHELNIEYSTFVASLCIGIISIFFSAKQNIPILVYAISSSIVLVLQCTHIKH